MLTEEQKNFLWNTKQPWFRLAYTLYWTQLAEIIELKNLKILDFGSGYGATANYLAKNNEVVAIEPNADMIEERERENDYTQLNGKIEKLKDFADGYFDAVTCHAVLEFVPERAEYVKEFSRVLKSGGVMSIIKHNKTGRVIHEIAAENNTDAVLTLLAGGDRAHNAFGRIDYYDSEDLAKWGDNIKTEKILGVRTFYALNQNQELKYAPDWIDKMFEIEMKVCDLETYKSIAYLNHVLLRKL